jgi:hypothetical protein
MNKYLRPISKTQNFLEIEVNFPRACFSIIAVSNIGQIQGFNAKQIHNKITHLGTKLNFG